jgi:hypothetical protein
MRTPAQVEKIGAFDMSVAQNNKGPRQKLDPPLPHNRDAELALLAACLADNNAIAKARAILGAHDFYESQHIHLFGHMLDLLDAGIGVDLLTLTDKIEKEGELQLVGGHAYIASLTDGLLRSTHLEHHAAIIKRKAQLRQILHAVDSVRSNAYHYDANPRRIMDDVAARFQFIEKETSSAPTSSFFDTYAEFENAPPLSFAIEGFLQNDATTGIAGLSGDSKTWTALSIIRALLFGPGKLWNLFEVPQRAGKVIYLIPESSRTPFKHRLQLMKLYDEICSGRLLVRTLSKGPTPSLTDAELLREAKGAHIIIDTAVRFLGDVDESSGTAIAEGLSKDFLDLLRADAMSVIPLFHSPKSFATQTVMSLENMIRGSSEFGAVLATAWGVRQIDEATNTVHVQNLKPRDFEPCGPFQLVGRPYIDQESDFHLLKKPGECGTLAEEQLNEHNDSLQQQKTDRKAMVKAWMTTDPNESAKEQHAKFHALGIPIKLDTVERYRKEVRRGA